MSKNKSIQINLPASSAKRVSKKRKYLPVKEIKGQALRAGAAEIPGKSDEIPGGFPIVRDSEREVMEREIRRFASFPGLNPNPVLEIDSSGKITFYNDATIKTLRKLGLSKEDLTLFLPDNIDEILERLKQKKEETLYREIRIKDTTFEENIYVTPDSNFLRIYAVDITQRKRAEEELLKALQESQQKRGEIMALLEGSRAVLMYHDFKSAARAIFNSCRNLIGATSGYVALLSKDGAENEVLFLDSGGLPCSVDPLLPMPIRGLRGEAYRDIKTVYDNDFSSSEWMKFMPRGHVRLKNVLFAPMVIDGKAVGLLGIANKAGGFNGNDTRMASAFAELAAIALTQKRAEEELKHMSDELARSNADLKQFAYAASHDLQEPLRAVEGFAKLLARRYKGSLDANADEFIEFIVDGVNRMQALIGDLLEYSQIGARGKKFKSVKSSLAVDMAVSNLQAALNECNAVVTYDGLPAVWGDFSQMSRLFQNLLGNAIKFRGKEKPRVHISAERKGKEWVFAVRDNGVGIEAGNAKRIFEIFQRLHGRDEYPGTGIGLAICKKIVERHGGRIWVESEIGKGSIFYFTIPFGK